MFSYSGGVVTRKKIDEAIDFFVEIETEYREAVRQAELSGNRPPFFSEWEKKYPDLNAAYEAIREFGRQIQPNDLKTMQNVFYSIVNSTDDYFRRNVISDYLTIEWDGIGEWRK
jgi:hypothetical protein